MQNNNNSNYLLDCFEHWQSQVFGARLVGRDTANHLGAIFDRLLRVERSLLSREALADDFSVRSNLQIGPGAVIVGANRGKIQRHHRRSDGFTKGRKQN